MAPLYWHTSLAWRDLSLPRNAWMREPACAHFCYLAGLKLESTPYGGHWEPDGADFIILRDGKTVERCKSLDEVAAWIVTNCPPKQPAPDEPIENVVMSGVKSNGVLLEDSTYVHRVRGHLENMPPDRREMFNRALAKERS